MKTLNRIVPVAFGLRGRLISGDYSEEDPPVPISNTVVKLLSADDTWRAAAWESRTSPVINFFMWLHGQAVKTPPFHGGNPGSIPGGVTIFFYLNWICAIGGIGRRTRLRI